MKNTIPFISPHSIWRRAEIMTRSKKNGRNIGEREKIEEKWTMTREILGLMKEMLEKQARMETALEALWTLGSSTQRRFRKRARQEEAEIRTNIRRMYDGTGIAISCPVCNIDAHWHQSPACPPASASKVVQYWPTW